MPSTVDLPPLAVAVPLFGAVVLAVAGRWLPRLGCDVLAGLWAAADVALLAWLWGATGDGRTVSWVGGWVPRAGHSVGVVLVADRIGSGIALLAALMVLAAVGYAWRYFEEPSGGHAGVFPALLLLFEAGMVGFALTGDLFDAFVFFELMGVVAYALTGYRIEDPRPLHGALAFGVLNSLAAYVTLLGIGLLYARTGELGFAQIGAALDASGKGADALVVCAFVFVLAGPLVKAALVPFHFWLPDAHAVAPSPVCMLLSGVMVELGVYGVARIYWTVFAGPGGIPADAVRPSLLALAVLTSLVGAVMCWQQRHIKRLLAFSTVAHVGLFTAGVAVLEPAALGGTAVYVAAHAGAKGALFALTGVLLDRFGSVDEAGLHGRGRELPVVGALFTVGAVALAGLPPFGTGLGKGLAEESAKSYAPWLPWLFTLVSAVTAAAVLRVALRVWWGAGSASHGHAGDPETSGGGEEPEVRAPRRTLPVVLVAVPALLLAGCLAVGVVPGVAEAFDQAARVFCDRPGYVAAALDPGTAPPVPPGPAPDWWSAGAVLSGLLSTALAVAGAAVAVWAPGRVSARARAAARRCHLAVRPLRGLHTGLIGDYVAWLTVGLAGLLVAVGALR
ncbi:complex I subunit 5 family protein [Yinghuangia seranimata]|uniref:complex I subunit 5 family protein n=1 Tax=Yinghuangia seranimata TaxID=408067 RepID=UPI00248B92F0|nr:proton-conducting transporter membrane subunit [Yinghuangia seranimata]MDI2125375.1 proton-conducting transporter membrane subunit [Yinghuangia seranimata]